METKNVYSKKGDQGMGKKKLWLLYGAAIAALILIALLIGGVHRPFQAIKAEEIAAIDITGRPPDVTRKVTDAAMIAKITDIIQSVVIYQRSDEWKDYAGQAMEYTLTMQSGEQLTVVAYNPFLVIDGQGYRTKYGPCEELNRLGNELIDGIEEFPDMENLTTLLGLTYDQIHERYGEPEGTLSGLWGDIYRLRGGETCIVYYQDGIVNRIKAGEEMFSLDETAG